MSHYVYGIVEPDATPPRVTGIAKRRLRVVGSGEAAALVSELPSGPLRLGREDMLIHSRVLEQALAHGTVLPMRFGVVMSDLDEVRRRLLDEHSSDLTRQLLELRDRLEVRIRALYDEPALLAEIIRADPEIARLREQIKHRSEDATYYGRIQLGELVSAAVERTRERDAAEMIARLAAAAIAVDEANAAHERVVFNASFLVDRERLDEFDGLLDEVAAAHSSRVRFKYTGPLPPYSFVQLAGSV